VSEFCISLRESVKCLRDLLLCYPTHFRNHPHKILQIGIKYRSRVGSHCHYRDFFGERSAHRVGKQSSSKPTFAY
jgi:hypothetical protein